MKQVKINLTIDQSQDLGLLIGDRLTTLEEDGDKSSEEYKVLAQIAGRMNTAEKKYYRENQ